MDGHLKKMIPIKKEGGGTKGKEGIYTYFFELFFYRISVLKQHIKKHTQYIWKLNRFYLYVQAVNIQIFELIFIFL